MSEKLPTEATVLRILAQRERALGFTSYADWLDDGCPSGTDWEYPQEKLDDIRFFIAAARPTDAVERVARAISVAGGAADWDHALEVARVAITALTDTTKDAAHD